MRPPLSIGLIALLLINTAFLYEQPIPAPLQGKWKLRITNSKLIGSLDIKSDGKYTYSVSPNYNESGKITVNQASRPSEINFIVSRKGGQDITKGIYQVVGGQLSLCMGKKNGDRPRNFSADTQSSVIFWKGIK